MDSINKNQPEHNRDDLSGARAMAKIREIAEKAGNCFFCTGAPTGPSGGNRPMRVQEVDAAGHLWFFSADDSHKNREIEHDPRVRLYFLSSSHGEFLLVNGRATISTDRVRIEQLWNPVVKVWFTEGIDDPGLTLIRFVPEDGYYWDTKHGATIAGVKMLIGVVTGKTLDDSVEGNIQIDERGNGPATA